MTSPAKTDKTPAADKPEAKNTIKHPEQIRKAIALGKDMSKEMGKDPEITKAAIAAKMYELIKDESREVIAQAFVDGAALTPKGAMTYYYNTKRKAAKSKVG